MEGWIDWTKNPRSPNYRGAGSYATFMIIGPTCFALGILFASFPYDFPLLWSARPVPASYYDQLETHLRFMHSAPPLIGRVLNIVIFVGFFGFALKLAPRPSQTNFLFDGASLMLYVIGVLVYVSNIVKGLRDVTAAPWEDEGNPVWSARPPSAAPAHLEGSGGGTEGEAVQGREDTMRVLSASNTILALVLLGILVLQSGQWYAEHKEIDEYDQVLAAERKESSSSSHRTPAKKKL